ncbi:MAG: FtsX-like permease family protein [Bacilli bacterium]|nr:FtsX-like permease family protein [Bacilli bacterium]
MKNRLLSISTREIKKSYKRFLSLVIMSLLGVAVFVGLRNTPGTILKSLDKYYDETNHYDIKIYSTIGFNDEDLKILNSTVATTYGIHTKDVITNFKKDKKVTKIIGLNNDVNKILLDEGTLPSNKEEIVVESYLLKAENLKIGDYIEIEEDESLNNHRFKIVGVVTSPLYLYTGGNTVSRGTTDIGNGKIVYYAYALDSLFNMDYYTELDVTIPNNYLTSTKEYIDLINEKIKIITTLKKQREKARYNEIINKYNIIINEQEELGRNELAKAQNKLNNSKKELNNGYLELLRSKNELDNSKVQLNQIYLTLSNSQKELEDKEMLLVNAKKELEDAEKEINELLKQYGLTIDDIKTIKAILNDQVVSKEKIKHIFDNSNYKEEINKLIDKLYETDFFINLQRYIETKTEEAKIMLIDSIPKDIENYEQIVKEIELFTKDTLRENIYASILDSAYNIDDIKSSIPECFCGYNQIINLLDNYANSVIKIKELFDAIDRLEQGKEEIINNESLLHDAKKQLEEGYQTYTTYMNQYNDGLNKYNVGYKEYQKGLNLYNSGVEEYLKNKLDFENELDQARAKLTEIEMPEWYIYDRSDDGEYTGYINNSESIKNLAKAFPTIFFTVAIFMCIMSMSRMALEDRQEIGTLKSLGFSNKHIILKYVLYSLSATLIGSILGGSFGFYFLTWFIFKMYGMLYFVPVFTYLYNLIPFIVGTFIAVVSIVGTSLITVKRIVTEKPSSLLRPLAPNKGKKILVERVPLWKKVKFSNKITIRNIFRYKKRIIMTIFGITGCTILLLTGYGIKDSIVNISDKQFKEVLIYDDMVYLDSKTKDVTEIIDSKYVKNYEETHAKNMKLNETEINLFAIKKDFNYDLLNLRDYKTNNRLKLEDNKAIITEKLFTENHLKLGDKIKITDSNNKTYEIEISGVATNYIGNYIYISTDYYEYLFEEYKPNLLYLNLKDRKLEEEYAKLLIKNEHVLSIDSLTNALNNINAMLKSIDYVVLIFLLLSGILSFVVLYNLSYINISERKREIATLKVLGFTHKEVDNYIIKENFIITLIGISLGLILTKPFVDYIVDTIEIDLVRFIHVIKPTSYLYTFIFMLIFTFIVTIIIHYTLKKINMIGSLKSVE